MNRRIALLLIALLVPCVAFAQTPAPVATPAQQPGGLYKTPAPGAPAYMEDMQESMPPMPPKGPRADLGKWWKNSDVVQDLQLTEEQILKIETTFLDHRLKLIDLKADVERNEARLQPLIEADRPDEAKVSAQLDLLLAARGKLEKENAMMMLSIRRVLSVEQWKQLEAIQQGNRRMEMKMKQSPYTPMHPKMRQPMPAPPAPAPPPARPPDA